MTTSAIVLIVLIVALIIWLIAAYNGLVARSNQIRNAFSQIDVQLQRRYDLIPNLVEIAKGYIKHERETLEAVIAARNTAQTAAKKAEADPSAAAVRELSGAESALGGLLTRFFALSEAYPDLKANQNMLQLQEELASAENRVAFARQAYNDAVMTYNTRRESFPDMLIATRFGFKPAAQWITEDPAAVRQTVKVSF